MLVTLNPEAIPSNGLISIPPEISFLIPDFNPDSSLSSSPAGRSTEISSRSSFQFLITVRITDSKKLPVNTPETSFSRSLLNIPSSFFVVEIIRSRLACFKASFPVVSNLAASEPALSLATFA